MMRRSWALLLLTPFLAAAAPLQDTPAARVTGLRLTPVDGEAELVVEMSGTPARWSDFTLEGPPRVVLDIAGARETAPQSRIEQVGRAGITSVRTSQFSSDVVRVVVDLEREVPYTVVRGPAGLHVRFAVQQAFEPWSTGLAGRADSPPPVLQQQVRGPQPRITVSFQDADIRDVLASFAEFTGRSIVPGAGVSDTVTATIRDQPWDVALQTILSAYGLAAQELPSGIIQVDAVENLALRQTAEPLITQTVRINYVPVQEIMATLQPLVSERGRVSFSATTNTLIISEVPSVVAELVRMVQGLDVPTPQVSIEAKIIFVNRTRAEELGVVYDLKDSRGNSLNRIHPAPDPQNPSEPTNENVVLLGGNSIAALGNANVRVQGPQLETLISLVLGRYTLFAFLEALQSAELSDVQASPTITAMDNVEAEIRVGEQTPIRVVDLGAAGGGAPGGGGLAVPRASAELISTGIILRVTPHVTADRRILMQLHAERSSAQAVATDIGVNFLEQVGRTRLMVNDGETAVIGGLTVTEVSTTRAGIPFLMDLPGIGRLFRTERKREQKRDLLILVTPHIIEDRAPARS